MRIWKIGKFSYNLDKLFWERNTFSYSLWCFDKSLRIAWMRTEAHPALKSLPDEKLQVFNVFKKNQPR